MTTLQKRSTALFSAGRSLIGDGGELRQKGLFGGHEWVVPRADCQYRQMDFSSLPARQQVAAARLAVARFEPSVGARTHIAGSRVALAHYWIWVPWDEAGRVRRWIPESLLRAAPAHSGVRLVQLQRGVEGQVWQDGVLKASQWWAAGPELSALAAFPAFVRSGRGGHGLGSRIRGDSLGRTSLGPMPGAASPSTPKVVNRWRGRRCCCCSSSHSAGSSRACSAGRWRARTRPSGWRRPGSGSPPAGRP